MLEKFFTVINHLILFEIGGIPLIVAWLISASLVFTVWMKAVNIRAFKHAIAVVLGKYDDTDQPGEVSHFQALATALSATIGLGNIAGVAIAIRLGGPGACFWMTVAGFLGMSSKFVECSLAQKYRIVHPDGTVAGGPMYYLSAGLAEIGYKTLGQFLAVLFAVFALAGGLGSAVIFQANQSRVAVAGVIPFVAENSWVYGVFVMILVGAVIIGGIKRIAQVAETLVPLMCGIYLIMALWILLTHWYAIPDVIQVIFNGVLSPEAATGGFLGAVIQGFRRSAFSNVAGLGVAAIAHATARTKEPIREGIVALLEPFIDTVIICNLTAFVIIITGAYNNPNWLNLDGADLTAVAFGSASSWFPTILAIILFLFACSTMISWGYYSQICWQYLWGNQNTFIYKILFLIAIFIGAIISPEVVVQFGDAILLMTCIPNLLGVYLLCPIVAIELEDYFNKLKAGQFNLTQERP
ncbi:MAG: alanine/glycine:cation symporter family protein [Microcoleaceae cyanobacterium]